MNKINYNIQKKSKMIYITLLTLVFVLGLSILFANRGTYSVTPPNDDDTCTDGIIGADGECIKKIICEASKYYNGNGQCKICEKG